MRAIVAGAARRSAAIAAPPRTVREVARLIAAELARLPYDVIAERGQGERRRAPRSARRGAGCSGTCANVLQPTRRQGGTLSLRSRAAARARQVRLAYVLPLKQTLVDDLHGVPRRAQGRASPTSGRRATSTLPPGAGYAPVTIAVWDSGVDTALFPDRVVADARARPALIAFDRIRQPDDRRARRRFPRSCKSKRAADEVAAQGLLRPAVEHRQPRGERGEDARCRRSSRTSTRPRSRRSGSPAITCTERTSPGIAVAGNPVCADRDRRASSSTGTLLPDPCPTRELAEQGRAATQQAVRRFHEEERRARRQHELGRQRQGHRERARALQHRQDARRAQDDRARVLRHREGRAHQGVRERA